MGQKYVNDLAKISPLASTHVISLRDDAPHVRWLQTRKLRANITEAKERGNMPLILPLLVSKGGIEEGILERMKGLDYIWTGEVLLPDPILGKLILNRLGQ